MSKHRVLVAMSGGVDSSVAAAILKDKGYDVIGATMKVWPREYCGRHKERSCCSLRDIEDAKGVCDALGIRHYVLNFEEVFRREVIDYFTRGYLAGRTPNPCIVCNQRIKFGAFLKKAEALECYFIATGHYARIERNCPYRLREAVDKVKDQSYVLSLLTDRQMRKILFPLGELKKEDVRKKARELGLRVHKKTDSQDICFVPGDNYSEFIMNHCGIKEKEGDIVASSGKVLGGHKGFWNFTIGQRRGLGISHSKPLYVINIIPEKNQVIAGEAHEIKKRQFIAKEINWVINKDSSDLEAEVKIRYTHKKAKALVKITGNTTAEVKFDKPQDAITPGQAAVFYKGDYVLGGGWIEKILA
ncbi:MAG: tRNA 2-thiouridine(34) synthase MnmA [Candidatus Omnitrophota bacterium]